MKKIAGLLFLIVGILMIFSSVGFAQDNGAIQVQDAVICQDVVDRAPVGNSDVFPTEVTRLFCFTRIVGAETEMKITHNWYYKGGLQASVQLRIGSKNWRTWSSKSVMPDMAGEWMVEVVAEDGTPLESIIFFIQ